LEDEALPRHYAEIEIELDRSEIAYTLYKALLGEALNPVNREKTRVDVEHRDKVVVIRIATDTLSHLRAVTNSFFYLVHSVLESISRLKNLGL